MKRKLLIAVIGVLGSAVSVPAQHRFLVVTDSTGSGTGLHRQSNNPWWRLQRKSNSQVTNFGSPGATVCDKTPPFDGMYRADSAIDLWFGYYGGTGMIIMLGLNDWALNMNAATFMDNYDTIIKQAPPNLAIACITPVWNVREGEVNADGYTLQDFRDMIRLVCEDSGRPVLDGLTITPNDRSGFPDGTHPSDRTARGMTRPIVNWLESIGWPMR
jgi:lysophospholipase L1-like esterase